MGSQNHWSNLKMKSPQLQIAIIFLSMSIQTDGQTVNSNCGQLGPNDVIPLSTYSFHTHHWPWHAAIYHKGDSVHTYVYGGTVISSKSILTAAHCVYKNYVLLDVDQVSISLGRRTLHANESSGQDFQVTRIIVHPSYNSVNFTNDIAIVRISPDATIDAYVQPICLWKADSIDLSEVVGKAGTVIGWGVTETGQTSNILQELSMPVVDFHTCLDSDRDFFGQLLSPTNFCAGRRNGLLWDTEKGHPLLGERNSAKTDVLAIRGVGLKIFQENVDVPIECPLLILKLTLRKTERKCKFVIFSKGTSVCTGDSGGSMSFEDDDLYYIRGIVSVGRSKVIPNSSQLECDSVQYAIFTDVAQYLQWIKENTAFKCERKERCALESTHAAIFGSERATRSTDVIIVNRSNKKFTLDASDCNEGGFATDFFPDFEIRAMASTVYAMESHGFASGCACTVRYISEDGTVFEVTSRNPYIGSNSVSILNSDWLKVTPKVESGFNNQVEWIIEDN